MSSQLADTDRAVPSPIAAAERLVVVDVLRGFALFGILVVNMAAFKSAIFGIPREEGLLNLVAGWVIAFAFVTKFYVLFSFLFGYGLSVQMARAATRGTTIVPRFLRRLIGLLLLGIAHGLLLYTGDILVTYAILGLILLLLRDASEATLLRSATLLVAASVIIFALIGVAFVLLSVGSGGKMRAKRRARPLVLLPPIAARPPQ